MAPPSAPWLAILAGLAVLAAAGAGCGETTGSGAGGAGDGDRGRAGSGDERERWTPPPVEKASRALGPTATFADLAAAAGELDQQGRGDAEAGCLLRGGGAVGAAWRLEADLAVAVRPLPPASPKLAERAGDGPVRVMTRWGAHGETGLSLVAFTTAPPPARDEEVLAVLQSDDGVRLRSTHGAVQPPDAGPFAPDATSEHVTAVLERRPYGLVVVSAAADVRLALVRDLLGRLPDEAPPIAFATPLPPETKLPEPDDREAIGAPLCEQGLPPLEPDAPTGDADPAGLVEALEPLREDTSRCMQAAVGEAVGGGRITLAIRIDADGRVAEVCATGDTIGDPRLRACVVEAARSVSFPEPDPAGFVDLALPLRLAPADVQAQRPLCD